MNLGYMRYMKEIKQHSRKQSIAFVGDEEHFKSEGLRTTLQLQRKMADLDEEHVDGGHKKARVRQITDLLDEYPLIGKVRNVVVTDLNQVKDYEKVADWLKSPTEGVRFIATFDDELKRPPESLGFEVVVVCKSPGAESAEFLKYVEYCLEGTGKKLSAAAVETCRDLFVENLHMMRMELYKAALFIGERTEIEPADLVRTSVVYPTSKVFDLIEALVARDALRSLRIVHELLAKDTGMALVIHLLTQRMQVLSDVMRATAQGEKLKDYMIRRKIPLFQYEQLVQGLRLLKDFHIRKFFDVLCEYEYKLKTNLQEDRQAHVAEMMVLQLCR